MRSFICTFIYLLKQLPNFDESCEVLQVATKDSISMSSLLLTVVFIICYPDIPFFA